MRDLVGHLAEVCRSHPVTESGVQQLLAVGFEQSKTRRLPTTPILTSSAIPLRTCAIGRVERNEKSRMTFCDAW